MDKFDVNSPTVLCKIMGKNKSDKGGENIQKSWHNYTTVYYSLFKHLQDKKLRIFELGVGTNNINLPSNMGINGRPGASLYGWAEFFKNADIFGADIDKNILFNTNRIKTFYCDQTNPQTIKQMWDNPCLSDGFDIIIDDGLHTFDANVCFFENSAHKLNKNGFYIIEDIHHDSFANFRKKIHEWKHTYPHLNMELLELPSRVNLHDNNLLIAKQV